MKQLLNSFRNVLELGDRVGNRTGTDTISLPGEMMRFNLKSGFPAVTTKKLAWKSVCGELCAFLRAKRSAADFRALGCNVWDQNANENKQWLDNPFREGVDDLGPIYGVQWRHWDAYKVTDPAKDAAKEKMLKTNGYKVTAGDGIYETVWYKDIDQLRECLDTIMTNPSSRRILFHAWNPAVLDEVSLPACHLLYQFIPNPNTKELSMCLYIRSNDLGLGAPFNIAEGALLLSLVAHLTGYTPAIFTYFIGDAHIYVNHMDMVNEQLIRTPLSAPKLIISDRVPKYANTGVYAPEWLDLVEPSDFTLEGYQHHTPLTAPMAV